MYMCQLRRAVVNGTIEMSGCEAAAGLLRVFSSKATAGITSQTFTINITCFLLTHNSNFGVCANLTKMLCLARFPWLYYDRFIRVVSWAGIVQ